MKHTAYIVALMALAAPAAATAQDLSGSVTVQGTYNPTIRPHSRLSGLPARYTGALPEASLPVATGAVPADVPPGFPAFVTSDAATALPPAYNGYFNFSAGSYLDISASAGYRFVHTPATQFGAWLQHTSSTLFRPGDDAWPDLKLPYRRRYDETIGVYGSHTLEGVGTFSGEAAYHLGYFNYYSDVLTELDTPAPAPYQTLNDASISLRFQGERPQTGLFGDGRAAYRYFGYRRLFAPDGGAYKPMRESDLRLGATVGYRAPSLGTFALDADAQLLFYSHTDYAGISAGNNGVITLTPAWTRQTGPFSLRLGLKADISTGFSTYDFAAAHIAPDVAVSYTSGPAVVSLSATGGVTPNTLASGAQLDYYQCPQLTVVMPMYRPVDATLALRFGPFSGLNLGVHASWAKADNTPVGGWYPYWFRAALPGDWQLPVPRSLHGFSLGAEAEYAYGRIFTASAAMTYQPQKQGTGYFNGLDRPRWTADITAAVSPLSGLQIGAAYHYRGVRRLYLGELTPPAGTRAHNYDDPTVPAPDTSLTQRLQDIYRLGLWAQYTIGGRYTLRLDADNLLGSRATLCTLMPDPGFALSGSVQILF